MNPKKQIEIIKQGIDEIIGEDDLIEKLKQGKNLQLKLVLILLPQIYTLVIPLFLEKCGNFKI